jgi:hypothetical protein
MMQRQQMMMNQMHEGQQGVKNQQSPMLNQGGLGFGIGGGSGLGLGGQGYQTIVFDRPMPTEITIDPIPGLDDDVVFGKK